MPGTLFFDLPGAVLVAEATVAAADHADSFVDTEEGRKTGPALMWVKDSGTYLMSNARPRPDDDVVYGRADGPTGRLLNGRMNGGDYQLTAAICGGDDFAEYFELDEALLGTLRHGLVEGFGWLTLEVSDDAVKIGLAR